MQELIIMQGWPSSGKSTMAKAIAWDIEQEYNSLPAICSTDDYFYCEGKYVFNPKNLGLYHKANQQRVEALLRANRSVIVDNTNIRAWEAKPYVAYAIKLGIPVRFVRCEGNYKNTHGVPEEKIEQMKREIEELTVEKVMSSFAPWEKNCENSEKTN
jgi:NEDD4-binding protein 2